MFGPHSAYAKTRVVRPVSITDEYRYEDRANLRQVATSKFRYPSANNLESTGIRQYYLSRGPAILITYTHINSSHPYFSLAAQGDKMDSRSQSRLSPLARAADNFQSAAIVWGINGLRG